MNKKLLSLYGKVMFVFIFMGSFNVMASDVSKKVKYFSSFTGAKQLPILPDKEISQAEALSAASYLIAVYDIDGRLIKLTKYIDGEVFFIQVIEYDGDSISNITITDNSGKITRKRP